MAKSKQYNLLMTFGWFLEGDEHNVVEQSSKHTESHLKQSNLVIDERYRKTERERKGH